MKLIDERLVKEAATEHAESCWNNQEWEPDLVSTFETFKAGVSFAEQQLKQKMIEFADWTSTNFTSLDGIHCKIGENKWITSEKLLEEFINQQK